MIISTMKPQEIIKYFLLEYNKIQQINDNDFNDIKCFINFMKTRKENEKSKNITKEEEIRWYNSLNNGEPDYTVYNSDNYYKEVIACFIQYSREYILALKKTKIENSNDSIITYINSKIKSDSSIVDLGNGIGFSSIMLSEQFNKYVIGTNYKPSRQWDFIESIKHKFNIGLVETHDAITDDVGVVFASEYFEHIENPFNHLIDIIQTHSPKFSIIANSFNTTAVGHFDNYLYDNNLFSETIPSSKAQKLFINILYDYGYKKVDAKLWNNTPIVLEKC